MLVLKSNYEENVSKALANLKKKVKPSQSQPVQNNAKPTQSQPVQSNIKPSLSQPGQNNDKALQSQQIQNNVKPSQYQPVQNNVIPSQSQPVQNNDRPTNKAKSTNNIKPVTTGNVQNTQAITKPVTNNNVPQISYGAVDISSAMPINESAKSSIHASNYASICIEDIAADFEASDHHNDINFSPVSSPHHLPTAAPDENEGHVNPVVNNKDPLNLQEDISFFDDNPVASSSMNVSVRRPLESPWRIEFGSLPMKWPSNTYIKPNMTPAVESSFINSESMAKKKHVYTNTIPENEANTETVAPHLKQTSIIDFMREAAEKSANKKKRWRSPSPTKANSLFDDITNMTNDCGIMTPKKAKKTAKDTTPNVSSSIDKSNNKENSNQSSDKSVTPAEAEKKKDKDLSYFGFDDSENLDQENISPVKKKTKTKTRGLRSRTVLQDFNAQVGPTRAVIPVAAKTKLVSSKAEQLFDKPTVDALEIPETETSKEPVNDTVTTNPDDPSWHDDDDDSQSVHLFEDIEAVHYAKVNYFLLVSQLYLTMAHFDPT